MLELQVRLRIAGLQCLVWKHSFSPISKDRLKSCPEAREGIASTSLQSTAAADAAWTLREVRKNSVNEVGEGPRCRSSAVTPPPLPQRFQLVT